MRTFLENYSVEHDLKQTSKDQLLYALGSYEKHLGRAAALSDFKTVALNAWIDVRLKAGLSRKTVSGQRTSILTLWRDAHRQKLVKKPPEEIRRIKVPVTIPTAWSTSELRLLMTAAGTLQGAFCCGVPRRLLIRALFLTGFYSGLRPCDLLSLQSAWIGPDGRLVIIQQKTGQTFDTQLPLACVQALAASRYDARKMVFPITQRQLYHWTCVCCRLVGLDGSPKWLRRTGATQCEIAQGGSAMAYLGHRTPGLAYRHYVDLRQVTSQRPVPPPLGLPDGDAA